MKRIRSIDLLRGLVMVFMALDHVRDFWAPSTHSMSAMDPDVPTEWYLTRWVTHLCAPAFVFLAGTSARLFELAKGASKRELSKFLFTRGLWLVFVEFVIVNWCWQFSWSRSAGQVIWALGVSMITLAVLVHLPRWAVVAFGAALVLGHDLFDRGGLIGPLVAIEGRADTGAEWVWAFLHERASGTLGGQPYFVSYPLIPWLGVMALGYVFADVLLGPAGLKKTGRLGLAMVASFVFLRLANVYGDPSPWSMQGTGVADTIKSFFNVSKYPPSLDYLLITLGISLALMPHLERLAESTSVIAVRATSWLAVFGRVPFFYYVLHLPLIHASSRLYFGWENGSFILRGPKAWPEGYEPDLLRAYVAWALTVIALYWPCRWYADLKRRHPEKKVLSYL